MHTQLRETTNFDIDVTWDGYSFFVLFGSFIEVFTELSDVQRMLTENRAKWWGGTRLTSWDIHLKVRLKDDFRGGRLQLRGHFTD